MKNSVSFNCLALAFAESLLKRKLEEDILSQTITAGPYLWSNLNWFYGGKYFEDWDILE